MLVEKDEERRQVPGFVVRPQTACECGQVSVHHLARDRVNAVGAGDRREVMAPEHVKLSGFPDRPQQFPVELQIGDVTNLIPCGEGRVRHSLDERVQFRL